MKKIAKLALTLAFVCALSGLGLAVVYNMTEPIIEQRAEEDLINAVEEVLPKASEIERCEENGIVYWIGKANGKTIGAAMEVETWGYGTEPIKMMVGIDSEGRVTKVKIMSLSETPGIGSRVNSEEFLSRFSGVDNPVKVEGISGATVSSGAVKGGVASAVEFLKAIVTPEEEPIDIGLVADGTYEGIGEGLFGPIRVSVTVQGGKIIEVRVLEHNESEGIADPAISSIPKGIVEKQRLDVDVVSGATFTSKGIIEAVKNALR